MRNSTHVGRPETLSEVASQVDFSDILYAQCWEDADVLLPALQLGPGDLCLSISSAGDNVLALVGQGPERVIALDLNPAQLACLRLRLAAYRVLEHQELLELIGSVPSRRRLELYQRCRKALPLDVQLFWDTRQDAIASGIGSAGKLEHYFRLFRTHVLPLIHRQALVEELFRPKFPEERLAFYRDRWNTWRWRLLFRLFFSRTVMSRTGREQRFFAYVTPEETIADRFLERTRFAFVELDPATNPYLQWLLTGRHRSALPYALRPENFDRIRANLDRIEISQSSLEDYLSRAETSSISAFNLSDVFEYMSEENSLKLLQSILTAGRKGARLAYWNMLVPRSRPPSLANRLISHTELAQRLFKQDKAFFYRDFVVEEIA